MDLIISSRISITAFEMMLLISLTTFAMVSGRLKLGLLINLCFTMYWGFMLNRDLFTKDGGLTFNPSSYVYWGFGFAIMLLAILGFITQKE
jgi:hypothetical protein